MKWLLVFVCIWAVVSAVPWCNCGPPEPPPEPICEIEVLPIPVLPPAVGLLTQVINKLIEETEKGVTLVHGLIELNNKELVDFIRENGGPGFNRCRQLNFFVRQSTAFWDAITDISTDISWDVEQEFNAAILQIEEQFSLVIDQPDVRNWLRELRDLPRIIANLSNQAIEKRRAQWLWLAEQYRQELHHVIQSGLCQSPENVQERFYRILRVGLNEAASILTELGNDNLSIRQHLFSRALELANNIYQVEIIALRYFVS